MTAGSIYAGSDGIATKRFYAVLESRGDETMSERSVNEVRLIGRIGKDIEVRFTPEGTKVGTFNLATAKSWKDRQSGERKEKTTWHRIVFWRCDAVERYLLKGKRIYLDGHLDQRSYEKDGETRYITEIVCDSLILLSHDREAGRSSGSHSTAAAAPPPASDPHDGLGITDDDIPF